MKWLLEVFWSDELTVLENLAMWLVGTILFLGMYAFLFLGLLLGETL